MDKHHSGDSPTLSNEAGRLWSEVLSSLRAGEGLKAERIAKRLIALEPQNDRAHFVLGNALCIQSRLLEALAPIDRCLGFKPNEPDYIAAKAQILSRLTRTSEAVSWYERALRLRPSPALCSELATALMSEGRVREALPLLESLCAQTPESHRPNALIAQALTETGQFKRAVPYWSSATTQERDAVGLLELRARSEAVAGRLQIAEELLQESIRKDPSRTSLYSALTASRKMSSDDLALIESMEVQRRRKDLGEHSRADLAYALGKAHHDLGDYQSAIRYFDEANGLIYKLSPITKAFDAKAWQEFVESQIKFFTAKTVQDLSQSGDPSSLPLFIVGMIRSGTTLTEQILSAHPMISPGGETTFWPDHREQVFDSRAGRFDTAAGQRLATEYARLLPCEDSNTRYVTEKNPSNVFLGGMLHCLYPNAKILHVKRHAVDTLLSIWMTPMKTGLPFVHNRRNMVLAFKEYRRLAGRLEEVLPAVRFRSFPYEAITSCPDETISEMLGFLGLDADPACLHPESNPRSIRTPSLFQARQPININSQKRWRLYEPWLEDFAELMED